MNFVVGKGDKEKYILQDVSGKVKWGRKSALVNCLGGVGVDCRLTSAFFSFYRCAGHYGALGSRE